MNIISNTLISLESDPRISVTASITSILNEKKVELHLHLDGSLRPDTVMELALKTGIRPKDYSLDQVKKDLMVGSNDSTLVDYLKKFDLPIEILQTKEALERVAFELGEDLAKENTIYAEIRVAPIQHIKDGLTPNEVVSSILKGLNSAQKLYPIRLNLLLCAMRHLPPSENDFLLDIAKEFKSKGVVGLDLAGDEAGFSATIFKEFFRKAKENNIPFTIHAGEARGPESIITAIELGASRIGHGIRAFEDEGVIELIKRNNICLECCPISNHDTNVMSDFSKYPIVDFLHNDISTTLNSDNRTVSNTNYNKEISFLKENIELSENDIKQFNINAVNHAFITNEIKETLLKQLNQEK